jgi:hypothetical protein
MANLPRSLTEAEALVLGLVQEYYGPWNTAEEVFVSDHDEAVIFVKDASGDSPICVNLTVCASAYTDGSLSLKNLKSGWLRIPEGG